MSVKTKDGIGDASGRENEVKKKNPGSFNKIFKDVTSTIDKIMENPLAQKLLDLAGINLDFLDKLDEAVAIYESTRTFFGTSIANSLAAGEDNENTPISITDVSKLIIDTVNQFESFTDEDIIPGDVDAELILIIDIFNNPEQEITDLTKTQWDNFDEISENLKGQILRTLYSVVDNNFLREKIVILNDGQEFPPEAIENKGEAIKDLMFELLQEFGSKISLPGLPPVFDVLQRVDELKDAFVGIYDIVVETVNSFKEEDEEDDSSDVMATFDRALVSFELITAKASIVEEIFQIKSPLPSSEELRDIAEKIKAGVEIYQNVRLGINVAIEALSFL